MSLCDFHWFSNTIGKQVGTYVLLPDRGKPPFATFYLLHGLSDDYTIWLRRTRIEMYVANLPLIVVMPDGFRGWYTKNDQGPDYATYIGQELVNLIDRTFPTKKSRSARAIGGLSMGGYGALRVGLGFPDTFASVNSHSGAVMRGTMPLNRKDPRHAEFARVLSYDPRGTDHDLVRLAKLRHKAGNLPRLLLDCGHDDFLIQENRDYHSALTRAKIPHEYREFPGVHDWNYWDIHIQEALQFHAKNLKLKPLA